MDLFKNKNIPRVKLARLPTPLVPILRFSKKHNLPNIWLKRDDLTDTSASGNKLRKLEFCVGQALEKGATKLITCGGTQSNHCRATAIVASQLGLKSHLILRGSQESAIDGNLLLDRLVGAEIDFVDADAFKDLDNLFTIAKEKAIASNDIPYCIPLGASDEVGMWGYINAAQELKQDFETVNINPKYIFSATGSGGTAAGLIVGKDLFQVNADIVSFNVSKHAAHFQKKIKSDIHKWQSRYQLSLDEPNPTINIVDGYVGEGYGVASDEIFSLIKDLAQTEGVILDPVYTAKAFYGMLSELRKGNFQDSTDIVFLHTGGIFGLFPQKEQLIQAMQQ